MVKNEPLPNQAMQPTLAGLRALLLMINKQSSPASLTPPAVADLFLVR
jgi:hypothetical protein